MMYHTVHDATNLQGLDAYQTNKKLSAYITDRGERKDMPKDASQTTRHKNNLCARPKSRGRGAKGESKEQEG